MLNNRDRLIEIRLCVHDAYFKIDEALDNWLYLDIQDDISVDLFSDVKSSLGKLLSGVNSLLIKDYADYNSGQDLTDH